jgi:hypothetical protein
MRALTSASSDRVALSRRTPTRTRSRAGRRPPRFDIPSRRVFVIAESNEDEAAASSSSSRSVLDTLDALREAWDRGGEDFNAVVRSVRDELTLSFFDVAEARVEELRAKGEAAAAEALDELCAAVYARANYSLDEIIAEASVALPGAADDLNEGSSSSETGLTRAQDEELRQRWGALTSALATTGESNAVKQLALNETSRRNAITEIAGRVEVGAREFETLKSVAPERRIVEVLLTIPSGSERAMALEDALTPPAEGEDVDGDEENEVVFTTPPRLLNVLEAMVRESHASGDSSLYDDLEQLRQMVEAKCNF